MNPSPAPAPAAAPVGGDPSKPGAWTPAQIAAWNAVDACTHPELGPRDDSCARCGQILRTESSDEPAFDAGDDRVDLPFGNARVAGEFGQHNWRTDWSR